MARPSLTGRTALVTGAAKRIGRSIALALAREGVNVIVHYRGSAREAASLAAELEPLKVRCWLLAADFGNQEQTAGLVRAAREAAGDFNILVNNASIFPEDTLANLSFESFQENLQVNAWAPFVLAREFAAGNHTPDNPGQVVNLIDTRVDGYDFSHAGYILSKHVLAALTRMTAAAWAPHVLVNGISPGLILPPAGKGEDYLQRLSGTTILNRPGGPEDVAEAAICLLKSDYMTGEIVHVDGGRHLRRG